MNGHDLETVGVGDRDALVGAGDVPVGVGDVVVGVSLEVPVGEGVAPGEENAGEGDAVEVAVSVAVSVALGSGDGAPVGAWSCGSVAGSVPSTRGASDSSSSPPRTVWLLSSATGMAQRCAPSAADLAS